MGFNLLTALIFSILLLPFSVQAKPLETVDHVDLNRYLGKWYEIARMPQFFQRKCARDVTAEYKLDEASISVTNSCTTETGEVLVAEGHARVVDVLSNAKLEVTFVKIFGWLYILGGDYWVIDLASDYRYAVIGHPNRKYAWVLARNPELPAADLSAIEKRLQENGYDTCALNMTVQTGGFSSLLPLCKSVMAK
jgi:apolipoprotein D and lipocalin family protein